eukprot:GILK01000935.1.p1 GENE.GILK01000935.1~~GILK01000935.1.p1  ORF type:complete len:112 (+),score=19.42 GILK01000935.1:37-336(+)
MAFLSQFKFFLKREVALITFSCAIGSALAIGQVYRLAFDCPDVVWAKDKRETNMSLSVEENDSVSYYNHPLRKFSRTISDAHLSEPFFRQEEKNMAVRE